MNLSQVTPALFVGGHMEEGDMARLVSELAIRHVVDVRSERADCPKLLGSLGMELLCLPTDDHHAIQVEQLERGVAWVSQRVRRGERVYIHCQHGIGRSVMLALCVLVDLGHDASSALRRIKRARACASPSPAQLEAFMAWYRQRTGQEPPTFDQLAYLAYHAQPSEWSEPSAALPCHEPRA